jgi:hypothetical protein
MTLASLVARLRRSESGVAMVEFAYSLPIVVPLFLGGAELTNYAVTRMRVSQIALHVADNASRIGTESLLSDPQISEAQINDLFTGANLQAGSLDIESKGRIILSSVEPDEDHSGKYKIHWQRCFGGLDEDSSYGDQGDDNLAGVGPTGQQVTAPSDGATMFVEVVYDYQPLITSTFVPATEIHETAAMTVRNDRDYTGNSGTGVYNNEAVIASSCSS